MAPYTTRNFRSNAPSNTLPTSLFPNQSNSFAWINLPSSFSPLNFDYPVPEHFLLPNLNSVNRRVPPYLQINRQNLPSHNNTHYMYYILLCEPYDIFLTRELFFQNQRRVLSAMREIKAKLDRINSRLTIEELRRLRRARRLDLPELRLTTEAMAASFTQIPSGFIFINSSLMYADEYMFMSMIELMPMNSSQSRNEPLEATNNADVAANEIILHENQDSLENITVDYIKRPSELFKRLKVWKWPRHDPGCHMSKSNDAAAVENSCICIGIAKDSSCSDIDVRRDRSAPVETAVSVILSEFDPTNTSCIFCQCKFSYDDTLCTLPCCHTFHKNGVNRWLIEKGNISRCPICRQSIFK